MLLVPTFLAPSPIQGLGLFTSAPLQEGTTIWLFDASVDLRLRLEYFECLPEPMRSRLREWTYEEPEGTLVLCGDNAKFMNHSFTPNCTDLEWSSTVTLRDIAAGEELTCDYRLIDMESARTGLVHWLTGEPIEILGGNDLGDVLST